MTKLRLRFAPSPTGYLHRGHVLSALWVWRIAHEIGAEILLRIEDHDQSRCREHYVQAIQEDLAWLGFTWDVYSRQSEHEHRYQEVAQLLRSQGLLYPCSCSRKDLSSHLRYPSTCRTQNIPWESSPIGIRIRIPSQDIVWQDLLMGQFCENPAEQFGDTLIRDRQGQWTYQYAVVVDDWIEQISHVVRGEDLLDSTARQITLAKILGNESIPQYLHHPLLYDAQGKKLSKRDHAQSIRQEREKGISAQELLAQVQEEAGFY